jgi:hypothetical protein
MRPYGPPNPDAPWLPGLITVNDPVQGSLVPEWDREWNVRDGGYQSPVERSAHRRRPHDRRDTDSDDEYQGRHRRRSRWDIGRDYEQREQRQMRHSEEQQQQPPAAAISPAGEDRLQQQQLQPAAEVVVGSQPRTPPMHPLSPGRLSLSPPPPIQPWTPPRQPAIPLWQHWQSGMAPEMAMTDPRLMAPLPPALLWSGMGQPARYPGTTPLLGLGPQYRPDPLMVPGIPDRIAPYTVATDQWMPRYPDESAVLSRSEAEDRRESFRTRRRSKQDAQWQDEVRIYEVK